MHELEIVLGVLQQEEDFLLQKRSSASHIGAAGLIGFFDSRRELQGSNAELISRTVNKGTTLRTTPRDWEEIGETSIMTEYEHSGQAVIMSASVFKHTLKKKAAVAALEGRLIRLDEEGLFVHKHELTPISRQVFEELIAGELWR